MASPMEIHHIMLFHQNPWAQVCARNRPRSHPQPVMHLLPHSPHHSVSASMQQQANARDSDDEDDEQTKGLFGQPRTPLPE